MNEEEEERGACKSGCQTSDEGQEKGTRARSNKRKRKGGHRRDGKEGERERERSRGGKEWVGREWRKKWRVRKNECFVFAHIPRNILCLSLLPLVYPVSVRPSFYFRFSFFLEPGSLHGAGGRSVVARPSPPRHQVRPSTYLSVSLSCSRHLPYIYIFQPVFTFEIKRGTNSRHRALMATTYDATS